MPKPRKSRSHRSQVAANLTGPGSSASGAGPSQMSANSMTINYTAMATETLRFMLSQRHLNQTAPRRTLITRLQESDSPALNTAPQVPDQLSAMIACIVEAKLVNLNGSRSTSETVDVVPPEIRELTNRRLSHDGAVGSPYSTAPSSCRNLNLRFAVKTTTFMRDRQIFSPFLKFVFIF